MPESIAHHLQPMFTLMAEGVWGTNIWDADEGGRKENRLKWVLILGGGEEFLRMVKGLAGMIDAQADTAHLQCAA